MLRAAPAQRWRQSRFRPTHLASRARHHRRSRPPMPGADFPVGARGSMDRASDFGSEGWRFESSRACQSPQQRQAPADCPNSPSRRTTSSCAAIVSTCSRNGCNVTSAVPGASSRILGKAFSLPNGTSAAKTAAAEAGRRGAEVRVGAGWVGGHAAERRAWSSRGHLPAGLWQNRATVAAPPVQSE